MPEDQPTPQRGVVTRKNPFIPRSNDEDTLWEVQRITEESITHYKVMWAGVDPDTEEPWPQSWVLKSDCTDKLVAKWEAKIRSKERPMLGSDGAGGSVGTTAQWKLRLKRKRQSEDDGSASADGCDIGLEKGSAKPSKRVAQYKMWDPLIKVGPPRGVRKKQPACVPSGPNPVSTQPSTPIDHPPEVLHKFSSANPSPNMRAHLRVFDQTLAKPSDGFEPSKGLHPLHQQQSAAEEEQPPSASVTADDVVPKAGALQPRDSMPDIPGLLAKVEEIKRLHCTIDIATNTALKLSLEAIETINSFQDLELPEKV